MATMVAIRVLAIGSVALLVVAAAGCARVSVDPIEVKPVPIHIVHDVNIRVDRELEDFFAFEDRVPATQPAQAAAAPVATQPAPATAPAAPAAPAAADAQ